VIRVAIFLLLAACGPKVIYVGQVDPGLSADFDALAVELPDLIRRDPGGVRIEQGTAALRDYFDDTGKPVVGLTDNALITIAPPGEKIVLTKHTFTSLAPGEVRIVLAHELGHALGLHHSDHGLMYPGINKECRGREAQCLIEALR
jgi:Zn-dependent protease with chaperone function